MTSIIKIKFTPKDVLKGKVETLIGKMIRTFNYIGNQCIIEARENGNYTDRTTNLRNSIGYVVLLNGVVQNKSLKGKHSKKLIEELMPKYSKGIVLIVVAGMHYATYVEAKNYNVLSSAELLAERQVPILLTRLGFTKVR